MIEKPIVVKIGGNEIDDPNFLVQLAPTLKRLDIPVLIVHGGGKEISNLQKAMGIEPRYIDGVRITDEPSLAIVEMVLCGSVNKRLVRCLIAGGMEAMGLSGVDRGLVSAEKMPHPSIDMQFTGEVKSVRGEILLDLLNQGITPVIAPVSLGPGGQSFNVNADHVAGAIAQAVGASKVVFLTNVEGVLINQEVVKSMSREIADNLIADGTIFGGMIPKVQTALSTLDSGIPQAVITNLTGLGSHGGTLFTHLHVQADKKDS